MKKKFRTIVVEGKTYGWTTNYMGHSVTIWLNKKPIHTAGLRLRSITPKIVESVIREDILKQIVVPEDLFIGIQLPVGEYCDSAMFFDGVVARYGKHSIITFQDGEIEHNGKLYVGKEIRELAREKKIDDYSLEIRNEVDIHVDKYFTFATDGKPLQVNGENQYWLDSYDEAVYEFKELHNIL